MKLLLLLLLLFDFHFLTFAEFKKNNHNVDVD